MNITRAAALSLLCFVLLSQPLALAQNAAAPDAAPRLIGEVFGNGRHLSYVSTLSDEVGGRLTGSAGARRAEEWAESEMKRLGLSNVRREPYRMSASWERGPASAALLSEGIRRPLAVASYTWTPGTGGAVEGEVVDVGAGKPEDGLRAAPPLKGR